MIPETIYYHLERHGKSKDDVRYISYCTGKCLKTRKTFYCSLEDFCKVTENIHWPFDLVWAFEIKIVGDRWWFTYDYHGDWSFHEIPRQPETYKVPVLEEIKKQLCYTSEEDL